MSCEGERRQRRQRKSVVNVVAATSHCHVLQYLNILPWSSRDATRGAGDGAIFAFCVCLPFRRSSESEKLSRKRAIPGELSTLTANRQIPLGYQQFPACVVWEMIRNGRVRLGKLSVLGAAPTSNAISWWRSGKIGRSSRRIFSTFKGDCLKYLRRIYCTNFAIHVR